MCWWYGKRGRKGMDERGGRREKDAPLLRLLNGGLVFGKRESGIGGPEKWMTMKRRIWKFGTF